MSRPVRDEDLLAWIEGDATPEQKALVEAALAEDSKLRAWASGAQRDRDMLRAWGEPGASMAPSDLVEQAIAMAERSALLDAPAEGLYELKTQSGPFRLFTPARMSIAAGLLVAVSAGIIALPALQGGKSPITAPSPVAPPTGSATTADAQPAEQADEGAQFAEAERQSANDLADLLTPLSRPGARESNDTVGRLAMSEPTRDDAEFDADSAGATDAVLEAPRVLASLDADEEAETGGAALREAVQGGAALPEATVAEARREDASMSLENTASRMAKVEGDQAFAVAPADGSQAGESKILALADEAAGWEGVTSRQRSQRGLPSPVLIGPSDEASLTGRDANGVETMSLREAEALAEDGRLVVQVFVDDSQRFADTLKVRASMAHLDLRDAQSIGMGSPRLLAVLGRHATVEDLLQQVTATGVQMLSLTSAEAPVATPVDFNAVSWWTLPVDQWEAASSQAVLVEVLGDDAPGGAPNRR